MRCTTIAPLALALLAGGACARGAADKGSVAAPAPLPATAADVLGAIRTARGPALVNVWATWCVPCRQEFPDLLRLRRELRPKGFELVLVSADFDESLPEVVTFLGQQGVDFPTWHKRQRDGEFIDALSPSWSGALPLTLLFDRGGKLRETIEGPITYEMLAPKVLALLKETDEP